MSKGLKFSPLFIAVILLAMLLVYLNWPQAEMAQKRPSSITPVVVEVVQQQEFAITIEALGTASANEAVLLTAKESSTVIDIGFDDGDRVAKGQLLLELNNREELARLHELQVTLQEAKRQERRINNLARENVASIQLLDEQQARVKALQAQLEVAKAKLAELQIRAPFAGRLGIRQVSLGALVRPGDLITTLDDLTKMKVDFGIAENYLPSVRQGQIVEAISVAYPGEVFRGQISSVDSRVDPVSRSIQIRAIIDNQQAKLRPGMLLQINLQKQMLNTIVIPEKALVPVQDRQYVYVLNNDTVARREVQLGARKPGVVQILAGLKVGERIVTEGSLRLRDGAKVRLVGHSQQGE